MNYKTIRGRMEGMVNDNYKGFVKAVISTEKEINDEGALVKPKMLIWTRTPLTCCMKNSII